MEIEELARKLLPVNPGVSRLIVARANADPGLRMLIDQQIRYLARRHLGEYDTKILLSLPPPSISHGAIPLGPILYEQAKWPATLQFKEIMQNTAVFGRSGAGKTNVAFHLMGQLLEKGIPFLFLDWKRTARHLLPHMGKKIHIYTPGRPLSPFPFNPFLTPPGLDRNVYINLVVDVLGDAYGLGDASRSLLQKSLDALYQSGRGVTVEELIAYVRLIPDKERVKGWKISTLRALESLQLSQLVSNEKNQEALAQRLFDQNTVVELDSLSHGGKKFLIPLLCLWLFHARLGRKDREKLNLVIFIEEAHHVLYRHEQRSKESVMNMLLRQCRELGIGFVVIDQHPHLISSAAMGNVYTSICMNLKDPTDINKAAGLSLVESSEKRYFSMLPVGQGIVKMQDRWRKPFLVNFPKVSVDKGLVSDDWLARYVAGFSTLSDLKGQNSREWDGFGQFRVSDITLDEAALRFIYDVIQYPDDGIQRRYDRLEFSGEKGNRIKVNLIRASVLEHEYVKTGQTRKLLLRLTAAAKKNFGLDKRLADFGSLTHEYWKRYYASLYQSKGYDVEMEALRPRGGGRVDVLARKEGETIAVEIETGKSDFVENVRRDLLSRIDKIFIVIVNRNNFESIYQLIAQNNLLIPQISFELV